MSGSKRILLINPSSMKSVYLETNVKVATLLQPVLSLPSIAAVLLHENHDVRIFDLELHDNSMEKLKELINIFKPDFVGITGTTPLYKQIIEISRFVKDIDKNIKVIIGGVHATVKPNEFLSKETIDIVVVGEGDFTIMDIVSEKNLKDIKGIIYKKGGKIIKNPRRELIKDLDKLPFPAWHLIDVKKYVSSYLSARKNPCGPLETSRGCVFGCTYCNKHIFGRTFRVKAVKRVVDEMEHMVKAGFKEIHIQDDGFSTDMKRAKNICDEIVRRDINIPWSLFNGIRVDRIDEELAKKLKKAGCYQAALGIESGNQDVLDAVHKGIKLEQIRKAVKILKAEGIEIFGFFMLGLPGETEKSMQDTIDFAKELDLDIVKFDVTIPYPGTELFEEWDKKGLIKTYEWSKYLCHKQDIQIYEHPNLKWDVIQKYYKKSFRDYYLRPKFMVKRFFRGIKRGELLKDIKSFLQTKW